MILPFDAVLFDCDGVLADSETLTHEVLCSMLAELGWQLSVPEAMKLFMGRALRDDMALIEQHVGPLPAGWMASFVERRNLALTERVKPIANIEAAVKHLHAQYAGHIACASGADRAKVEMMLHKIGLIPYFEGRVFSGHEMPRSKPFPDVYLAAAAALGVAPTRCAVIEDTVTGVQAGVAAGATVYAYVPPTSIYQGGDVLRQAGAAVEFSDMAELAELLGA